MPSRTATAVGDSVTGTSKVYKRNQQDWTNILLLTSKLVILVLQDQPNKIVFFKDMHSTFLLNFVWIIHFTLMLTITSFMSARNHSTKTAETHWNLFGFKNKNNLIDLMENCKRHALVGEVLIIRKLKCKNLGHYKFSPGLAFIDFVQLRHNV